MSLCQRLLSFPSPVMRSRPGKNNLPAPELTRRTISGIIGLLFGHIKRGRIAPKCLVFHNTIRDIKVVLPVLSASGHYFGPGLCANVSLSRRQLSPASCDWCKISLRYSRCLDVFHSLASGCDTVQEEVKLLLQLAASLEIELQLSYIKVHIPKWPPKRSEET